MGQELVAMSVRELDRLELVCKVTDGSLSQVQAAVLLGFTSRQVRRLCRA